MSSTFSLGDAGQTSVYYYPLEDHFKWEGVSRAIAVSGGVGIVTLVVGILALINVIQGIPPPATYTMIGLGGSLFVGGAVAGVRLSIKQYSENEMAIKSLKDFFAEEVNNESAVKWYSDQFNELKVSSKHPKYTASFQDATRSERYGTIHGVLERQYMVGYKIHLFLVEKQAMDLKSDLIEKRGFENGNGASTDTSEDGSGTSTDTSEDVRHGEHSSVEEF